jgi:hypothetical protein
MDDKRKIGLVLRAFKIGSVDFDYTKQFILDIFKDSKHFNLHSFILGIIFGIILLVIYILIT